MKVNLRPIEKADNSVIKTIIQESLASFGLDRPGTAYFDPELDDMTKAYAEAGYAYWVVECDGDVVGGIGVAPHTVTEDQKKVAELQKFYIKKGHQGKGYGRMLMDQAIAFAKQEYDILYLETSTALSVDSLYEHFSFKKLKGPIGQAAHDTMDLWYAMVLNEKK